MDAIAKKILAKRDRLSAIAAEIAELERERAVTEAQLAAYQEARDFYSPLQPPTKTAREAASPGRTVRALTGIWLETMRRVGAFPTFGVEDILTAASAVGHSPSKDNVRSQVFHYKKNGIVEALSPGVYRFTEAGREALGLAAMAGDEPRIETQKAPH